MTFLTCINTILRHYGQVCHPVKDAFSAVTTVTSISTFACYAYQDEQERLIAGVEKTKTTEWTVLVHEDAKDVLAIGEWLVGIKDSAGRTVVASGTISDFKQYEQWEDGLQFFQVFLSRD